jgi:hypothetical protein
MGWFHDAHPGHEGYVVGIEKDRNGLYRELGYPDREPRARVHYFCLGCDCGWRSERFVAPLGAEYGPFSTELGDEALEDACRDLWRRHVETLGDGYDARLIGRVATWTPRR